MILLSASSIHCEVRCDRLTHGVSIYEDVNKLYVGRKVVIVIEFIPTGGRERE